MGELGESPRARSGLGASYPSPPCNLTKVMEVRTIIRGGEPWFVANDVAEALGYSNQKGAVIRHCKCSVLLKGPESSPLTYSPRGINIIPEGDVYRLVFGSNLPSTAKFEAWVVNTVLPTIHKTGRFHGMAAAVVLLSQEDRAGSPGYHDQGAKATAC